MTNVNKKNFKDPYLKIKNYNTVNIADGTA